MVLDSKVIKQKIKGGFLNLSATLKLSRTLAAPKNKWEILLISYLKQGKDIY
jgi:hypothetical protein